MTRRDLLLAAGGLLLLTVAVVRIAIPEPSRLRALSIEGVSVDLGAVDAGETVTREILWTPPNDVYVLGWNPSLRLPPDAKVEAEMMLYDGATKTALFLTRSVPTATRDASAAFHFPPGTGYKALGGRPLTLRCRVTNKTDSTLDKRDATALIYLVPVESN